MPAGRPKSIEGSEPLNLHLPSAIRARLDLLLYSELEGKVPRGAYREFFSARINEFFETRAVDLSSLVGLPPGTIQCRMRHGDLARLAPYLSKEPECPPNS